MPSTPSDITLAVGGGARHDLCRTGCWSEGYKQTARRRAPELVEWSDG
jgi:hypothetical protein